MRERRRIVELYEGGAETADVAEALGASPAGVRRVWQHYREDGRLGPRPQGGGPAPAMARVARDRVLLDLVAERPDAFAGELAARLAEETGVRVCRQTVGRWLRELGVTRKKSRSAPASSNGPTSASSGRRGSTG